MRRESFWRSFITPVSHQDQTAVVTVIRKSADTIYDSLGTTDLTNWAREIVTISYEDWENRIFKLEFQKRAKRAGIVGEDGKPIYSLRIQHSKDRVAWEVVGNVFTGKATTKAQAQRSGRVKEVQDWMR